jgi:hypothetical protein
MQPGEMPGAGGLPLRQHIGTVVTLNGVPHDPALAPKRTR